MGALWNEEDLLAVECAADLLEGYGNFIQADVTSADIERHPYLPEVETTAKSLRALVKRHRAENCDSVPVEIFKDVLAHLVGAASAYRTYAKRHSSQGKSKTDAVFGARVADFDGAVERGRAVFRQSHHD